MASTKQLSGSNKELLEKIQSHLLEGGVVVLGTYTKATYYDKPRYADWFSMNSKGELFVRRGRSKDCFATPSQVLCAVRFGQYR